MATLSDIIADLTSAKELIQSRLSVDGPEGKSTLALQRKLGASVASKISRLPYISPGDAKHLLDAAKQSTTNALLS